MKLPKIESQPAREGDRESTRHPRYYFNELVNERICSLSLSLCLGRAPPYRPSSPFFPLALRTRAPFTIPPAFLRFPGLAAAAAAAAVPLRDFTILCSCVFPRPRHLLPPRVLSRVTSIRCAPSSVRRE